MAEVRLTEIFHSLQGEARTVGLPTVFVRLTGCPLRCVYCDTEYAFHGGQKWQLEDVLNEVRQYQTPYVCVTGGEPLAQPVCLELLSLLADEGFQVSLETSGAMPINDVDPRISVILDLKTPASGEMEKNLYENIPFLKAKDQIKLVICDRQDYDWARFKLDELAMSRYCEVLFSPSKGQISATELADWILADKLPVRFQMQLHKILWNDEPGR